MRTTARLAKGGAEWVVDGTKAFITNAGTAITSLVTVLAITAGGKNGRKEISSIIIPNGTPGFAPVPNTPRSAGARSDTRELSFTGCRVPAENLLGERGRGYAQFLRILDEGRVAIAALATGLARAAWTSASPTPGSGRRSAAAWSEHQAHPVLHRRHGGASAHGPAGLV